LAGRWTTRLGDDDATASLNLMRFRASRTEQNALARAIAAELPNANPLVLDNTGLPVFVKARRRFDEPTLRLLTLP
jgi:hypothetical protein